MIASCYCIDQELRADRPAEMWRDPGVLFVYQENFVRYADFINAQGTVRPRRELRQLGFIAPGLDRSLGGPVPWQCAMPNCSLT